MKITPGLLERYYKNLCSPEENKAVEDWQLSTEADLEIVLPEEEDKESQKALIWASLSDALAQERNLVVEDKPAIKRDLKTLWLAAACLLILSGTGLTFYSLKDFGNQPAAAINYKSVRTGKGQKANFELPDGSTIILNSGTELRYPEKFTDTSRIVYLTGEAHFNIAKEPSRPFSIYTTTTLTRVLGTAFNLKAYANEDVALAVEEGKVRFGGINNELPHQEYARNESGTYYTKGKLDKTQNTTIDYAAWTKNKIVFTGQTFREIIPVIERWYNVSIQIDNKALYKESFTGEFDKPSLYFLLDRMAFVMKFSYTINNKKVIIK